MVELRSVNHRFCDIKVKIPRKFTVFEERIKKEAAKRISRGHVDVMVSLGGSMAEVYGFEANIELARNYHHCLARIQGELGLDEPPTLAQVIAEQGIITPVEPQEDFEALWPELRTALVEALAAADAMRRDEGEALKNELLERLRGFEETVGTIEKMVPDLIRQKEAALQERLHKLLGSVDLDPARLAQEVAIIADKSDITEELVRLQSHISQFRNFMQLSEPVGRRIDFLMQEFLREINTMASKINNAETTHLTVDLKNEVEKMREQAANIE